MPPLRRRRCAILVFLLTPTSTSTCGAASSRLSCCVKSVVGYSTIRCLSQHGRRPYADEDTWTAVKLYTSWHLSRPIVDRLPSVLNAAARSVAGLRRSDSHHRHSCQFPVHWLRAPEPAKFKLLMGTLKPQSNRPLYSYTVIGTLAVDEWTITFCTARMGLVELRPRLRPDPVLSSLCQM